MAIFFNVYLNEVKYVSRYASLQHHEIQLTHLLGMIKLFLE